MKRSLSLDFLGLDVKAILREEEENNKSSKQAASKENVFVPQGVVGQVVAKGPIKEHVPVLAESVRHTLQHIGVRNLGELRAKDVKVEKRSFQAQQEGTVHGLYTYEK